MGDQQTGYLVKDRKSTRSSYLFIIFSIYLFFVVVVVVVFEVFCGKCIGETSILRLGNLSTV